MGAEGKDTAQAWSVGKQRSEGAQQGGRSEGAARCGGGEAVKAQQGLDKARVRWGHVQESSYNRHGQECRHGCINTYMKGVEMVSRQRKKKGENTYHMQPVMAMHPGPVISKRHRQQWP